MSVQVTTSFELKCRMAWGNNTPDWVAELAVLADQHGLKAAGERIKYSYGAISSIINNKYKGDLKAVEGAVRGALMGLTVNCPAQGPIGRHQCLNWQSLPYGTSDSTRVRVYRACRSGCPHSRLKQKSQINVTKEYQNAE